MKQLRVIYRMTLVALLQNRLAARNCTVDPISLFLSRRIDRVDASILRAAVDKRRFNTLA